MRGRAHRPDAHGPAPLRATAVEDALRGQPLNAESIGRPPRTPRTGTSPPADLNASQDYKRHLARVLCAGRCDAGSR